MKALCVFLLLASASAFAATCPTNTNFTLNSFSYTQTTDGTPTTRYYYQYLPSIPPAANPTVWVMLHPTTQDPGAGLQPCPFDQGAMQMLAAGTTNGKTNNIIVIWPISTKNPDASPACSTYIWNAWDLDYIFAGNPCNSLPAGVVPDDSGFIAALTGQVKRTYGPVTAVYVTGMSSGAFMAQRMGYEHPLLVQAVGAASGQIWAAAHNTVPSMPSAPGSPTVLMLNGDADQTVHYCGTSGTGWGHSDFPSSNASLQYWARSNTCSQQFPQLCNSDGTVNTSVTTVTCGQTTFSREVDNPHCWVTGTESRMWGFFNTGSLKASSATCPIITSFTPTSGPVGTTPVTITGGGFNTTTNVTFNGTSAAFTVISNSSIQATVPNTTTGKIAITTSGGAATSTTNFTVTPQ